MVSFLFVAPPQQTCQNVESCRLDTCPLNQNVTFHLFGRYMDFVSFGLYILIIDPDPFVNT